MSDMVEDIIFVTVCFLILFYIVILSKWIVCKLFWINGIYLHTIKDYGFVNEVFVIYFGNMRIGYENRNC